MNNILESLINNKVGKVITTKAGQILLSKGQINEEIFFVESGLLREYFLDEESEITTELIPENNFFYSTDSFLNQTPSKRYLEALEPSEIISIPQKATNDFLDKNQDLNKTIIELMEYSLLKLEQKIEILHAKKPLEKLEMFEKFFPNLSNRLSNVVLASYLGIAPQTLSTTKSKRRFNSSFK